MRGIPVSEENKALILRWLDEMDKHNFEFIDEAFSPRFICHFPGNPEPMKFKEYRAFIPSVYASFPDFRHEIEDLIAEGDRVVVRVRNRATHSGDFSGCSPMSRNSVGAARGFI
jgi:predicted ester cyclase